MGMRYLLFGSLVALTPCAARATEESGPGTHVLVADNVLVGSEAWARSLAFHPQGELLAVGGSDRVLRLWDWRSGRERAHFSLPEGEG